MTGRPHLTCRRTRWRTAWRDLGHPMCAVEAIPVGDLLTGWCPTCLLPSAVRRRIELRDTRTGEMFRHVTIDYCDGCGQRRTVSR